MTTVARHRLAISSAATDYRPAKAFLVLTLLLAPWVASAQVATGHVIDAATRAPIVGALVELQDIAGRSLQRVLTTPSGAFKLIAPAPGLYRYRVAAIGRIPPAVVSIDMPPGTTLLGVVALPPVAVVLPEILIIAHEKFCGDDVRRDGTFGRLIQNVQAALDMIDATIQGSQIRFETKVVSLGMIGMQQDSTITETPVVKRVMWPVASIDPESLRVVGFAEDLPGNGSVDRVFHGPDPRVLFADWFLQGHCFAIDPKHTDSQSTRIRFFPREKGKLVDISGSFDLDAHTMLLTRLTFQHENLPYWLPAGSAGGEINFLRLASGLWITTDWMMWAPIEMQPVPNQKRQIAGRGEIHGKVTQLLFTGDTTH